MQGTIFSTRLVALVVAGAGLLIGCGGGGGGTASVVAPTLSGLAATGAGIANAAVTAKCATGTPLTGTTDANGSFNLVLGGRTLPCMLQVTGGTPAVTLHSFAQAAGRTNITPVTDLIVAKALGADPGPAFASYAPSNGTTIEAGLTVAKSYVNTQINNITGGSIVDPIAGAFAVGDADDKVLDALGNAMGAVSVDIVALRSQLLSNNPLTATVPAYLAKPASLAASAAGSTTINLSWTAVAGATGYKIYRATSAGGVTSGAPTATSTTATYSDTGLSASTAYYYKVVPTNTVVSAGTVSDEATATTGAAGGSVSSTWTPRPLPGNTGSFADVVWDGSQFVAIGTYVGTSTDGATWTLNALLEGKGIAKSGSTLLLAGISTSTGSDIRKSVDGGTSWTKPPTANIFTVSGNSAVFVGIGGGAEAGNGQAMLVRTSTDGETWTTRYTEAVPNAQSKVTSLKPIWSGSKWLISAVKYDPSQADFYAKYEFFVLTSADGANWTKTVVTNLKGSYVWPWWPVWTGSQFVLIDRTKTLKSADGVTWPSTATTSNFTSFGENTYDYVSFTGTEFVAFSGGGSTVKVWQSSDAVSWTSTTTTATQPIYGGVSNGSTYVAVGNAYVFTSP